METTFYSVSGGSLTEVGRSIKNTSEFNDYMTGQTVISTNLFYETSDGTWLGDPAAGTGGATLNGNAGAPFYFSTSNGSTNSGQQNITVRKSPDDLTYTIPTGFGTH